MRATSAFDQKANDSNSAYVANPPEGNAAGPVFRYNAETFWLHGINRGLRLED